ncbi:unnamed protein product [Cuscuta campestris]|uniref:Uncharacterized protein n=1 Tax=Cuscuta campestris TaxID=132261 RepID=A0A484KP77_9ASTE|nr:unnamed protein product [Cuscuta campestris]
MSVLPAARRAVPWSPAVEKRCPTLEIFGKPAEELEDELIVGHGGGVMRGNNEIGHFIGDRRKDPSLKKGIKLDPFRVIVTGGFCVAGSLKGISSLPWCILDDFNDILSFGDKKGRIQQPGWRIQGFREAVDFCELHDLGFTGNKFTWERGRDTPNWVCERLDRGFGTHRWMQLFDKIHMEHVETVYSDHSALFLTASSNRITYVPKAFRFENAWLKEIDVREAVEEAWKLGNGRPIVERMNYCGEYLHRWGQQKRNIFKAKLQASKKQMQKYRNSHAIEHRYFFRCAQEAYKQVLEQQEMYWKQRAKQHWLTSGDQNTRYFHLSASGRKKNHITQLQNSEGRWVTADSGMHDLMRAYFEDLFKASPGETRCILGTVNKRITEAQNQRLCVPVVKEEVKRAVFGMHPDKSPGPDGFNPGFFQAFWGVVGDDVTQAIMDFMDRTGEAPGGNNTNIVLIPKKKVPCTMGDLRPISLCNVIDRIACKVMANRMQHWCGNNASFVWRSILEGRRILEKGCIRRIGNGETTKLLAAPWLLRKEDPYVRSCLAEELNEVLVSAFIDPGTRRWDMDLLQTLFSVEEVQEISRIPLGLYSREDAWIWRDDLKGLYSVKHGYRMMYEERWSGTTTNNDMWAFIWKMQYGSMVEWFEEVCRTLTKERVQQLCMVLWEAWQQRNQLVWKNRSLSITFVAERAIRGLQEWQAARPGSLEARLGSGDRMHKWRAPVRGVLKCNVDASFNIRTSVARVGVVVRDDQGNFLRGAHFGLGRLEDAQMAEATGLREALRWLRMPVGQMNLSVEIDSEREHGDLTKFLTRWKDEVDKVEEMDDKTAMSLLVSGLRSGELYKEFCRRPPQSYQEAFNTAWDYSDAEAQVSSKREAVQGPQRGRSAVKKEIDLPGRVKTEVLEVKSEKMEKKPTGEKQWTEKYCSFHKTDTYNTTECNSVKGVIKQMIEAGELGQEYLSQAKQKKNQWVRPEAQPADQNKKKKAAGKEHVKMIYGGPEGGDSAFQRKKWGRELYVGSVAFDPRRKQTRREPITFNDRDLPSTGEDHSDPLVITMDMGGVDVSRVLVDTGSSVNVLYLEAFEKLKLCRTRLEPLKTPMSGFIGDSIEAEGTILLTVELGTGDKVVQKQMRFVVVNIKCVHNAIVGRPVINKVRGIISMAHLCMKFYTPGGIGQEVEKEEDRMGLEPGEETEEIVPRETFPEKMVRIGQDLPEGLREEIISVLREYADIFSWSVADLPGIDRSIICHQSPVIEGDNRDEVAQFLEGRPATDRRLAALSRFLSRSAERVLPFFKVLKKGSTFEWSREYEEAFQQLKEYLVSDIVLSKPKPVETLYLYLGISQNVVSFVLIRNEDGQRPIYYVSKALNGAESRYTAIEKTAYALFITATKLTTYFQAHAVEVLTDQPLGLVLHSSTSLGRMIKWAIMLTQFKIDYKPRTAIKGQALPDFLVELTGLEPEAGPSHTVEPWWDMALDGASRPKGCGAGIVFTTREGFKIYHAMMFNFKLTNNEAEYEALAGGLRLAWALGIKRMRIRSDSSLVVGQVNGEMEVKEERLTWYSDLSRALLRELEEFRLTRIPWSENTDADMISKLMQSCPEHVSKLAKIEILDLSSVDRLEVADVQEDQSSPVGVIKADEC